MRSSKDANNVKNDRKFTILEQKSFQRLFLKNRLPHRDREIHNFLVKAHFDGSWL